MELPKPASKSESLLGEVDSVLNDNRALVEGFQASVDQADETADEGAVDDQVPEIQYRQTGMPRRLENVGMLRVVSSLLNDV